jgi:hypothetical protein
MILDIMRREKKEVLDGIADSPNFWPRGLLDTWHARGGLGKQRSWAGDHPEVSGAEISTSEFLAAYQRFVRNSQFPVDKHFSRRCKSIGNSQQSHST